jgi:hypothetical protein
VGAAGGAGEVALLGDGDEMLELAKLHDSALYSIGGIEMFHWTA